MPTVDAAGPRSELPGLQAERTALAWDRTAFALLVNGALLLTRHVQEDGIAVLVPAGWAVLLTVVVAALGRRRARQLRREPGRGVARRELAVAGAGVAVLAVAVLILIVLVAVRG